MEPMGWGTGHPAHHLTQRRDEFPGTMKKDILAVDIGNSNVDLGIYREGRVLCAMKTPTAATLQAEIAAVVDDFVGRRRLRGIVIASVVPAVLDLWYEVLARRRRKPPLVVTADLDLGLPIDYPEPETLGADRLANICGAYQRYGAPAIVADFGTACTVDLIVPDRGFVGGVILPGLDLMFGYLAEHTAQLPRVRLSAQRSVIGRSTTAAMQAGAQWGFPGMVHAVIEALRAQAAAGPITICATGGYAAWVCGKVAENISLDKDLTLFGLGRIFELNAARSRA